MIKKSIIALSAVAAIATTSVANDDISAQLEALKAQIEKLEAQLKASDKKITKVEKKVIKVNEKVNEVKTHDAGDNIKFDVDFRTQIDNIQYKLSGGGEAKNDALMSNRLWLGMGYQPNDNTIFKGVLSYNKLFGENVSAVGNSQFDWITNEAAGNDNSLNVKEVYWLYMNNEAKVPWTVSVGRRPSTDGLGINLRSDQQAKSPLAHTVNVEFDGASAKFTLDKLTGIEGMWFKFCAGRGLTNSRLRFDGKGYDYADSTTTSNIDMAGFIFVPYDNGQYSIHTNYAKAWNLIGYLDRNQDGNPDSANFTDFGDFELANIVFKADGIGNGISNYLDNTVLFASYAMSKTHPNSMMMLGSPKSEVGHSIWLGVNAPCPLDPEDSKIGIEWNKGSKYWRSFTYGEDTMVGSKVAARGTAWEIYRNSKINNALSWSVRYTKINYDYTGSNGFFGDFGTPVEIGTAGATGAVSQAQDISANIRYRF